MQLEFLDQHWFNPSIFYFLSGRVTLGLHSVLIAQHSLGTQTNFKNIAPQDLIAY